MNLTVQKLHYDAILPSKANPWDAGFDLAIPEKLVVFPNLITKVGLGIALAVPEGHVGILTVRSSIGARGIQLANSPGIIDAGYRGELSLILTFSPPGNNSVDSFYHSLTLDKGSRIAQLVVVPIPVMDSVWVDSLPESDGRESAGFGSSGVL